MASKRNPAIGFIFITLVIDVLGIGLIIPILPTLIRGFTGGDLSTASQYSGWLMASYAIMQFFFSPVLGGLSDQFGRRPIILASLFGFSIDYLVLANAPNITWLFIGRLLAGITGASFTTAQAYIADISKAEDRAKNFGMVGAAFGLGFIIGPVLGGFLGHYGSRVPFYAAAVLCMINFLYGYFILPESLSKNHRREFDIRRANPIGAIKSIKKHPSLIGLMAAIFLLYVGSHAVQSNWSYFTMYRFNWNEKMVGLSLGLIGLLVGIVQGGLVRWVNPRFGNEKSIYVGMALYTIGLFLFATANQSWMMFVFLVPYCLGGIAGPALQAIIASKVPPSEQGEIQGTMTSLMSASTIIGPPMMSTVFYFFTHNEAPFKFAGAPFVLAGFLMLLSTIVAYLSFKKRH